MSQSIRPRLTVLSAEQIARVHEASLHILATVGVRVDSQRARGLLARAAGLGEVADGPGLVEHGQADHAHLGKRWGRYPGFRRRRLKRVGTLAPVF